MRRIIDFLKQFINQRALILNQTNLKTRKVFAIVIVIIVGLFIATSITGIFKTSTTNNASRNDQRSEATKSKATQTINKTFIFPLKDDKNIEVGKFKYVIGDVQLQDEIIVKGQRATAVKGRTFLIVNLKIVNDTAHVFEINTRDFIRLSIKGDKERFAADIHNDPVQIQAIATKPTRLGFPINDSNRKFVLYVGEIKGEKNPININL